MSSASFRDELAEEMALDPAAEVEVEPLSGRDESVESAAEVDQRWQWIHDLETQPLDPVSRPFVCRILREFIEQYFRSEHAADRLAVGAAIRKLVLNLELDGVQQLAKLLDARPRVPELSLEFVKAVVWRLTADPPKSGHHFSQLEFQLQHLANECTTDALLPLANYGPTAMNSLLALGVLQDNPEFVLARLMPLQSRWFQTQFVRRCTRLIDDFSARNLPWAAERLQRLVALLTDH